MKLSEIAFRPVAYVEFKKQEIEILIDCSLRHYDAACKKAAEQGGFLRDMLHREQDFPGVEHRIKFERLDTMAKIAEMAGHLKEPNASTGHLIRAQLGQIMREMNALTPDSISTSPPTSATTEAKAGLHNPPGH